MGDNYIQLYAVSNLAVAAMGRWCREFLDEDTTVGFDDAL
jgi:hypothetical protein